MTTNNPIPNLEFILHKGNSYEFTTIEGLINLEVWKGFQDRQNDYGGLDVQNTSDGLFKLVVGGDMVIDNPIVSNEQVRAYKYAIENQQKIQYKILDALFEKYPELQQAYGYEEEDAKALMPSISNKSGFKNLIGLSIVHLLNVDKEDTSFTGYEFGCTWDDEHGLGIMTHKDRIIEIGGADTSFTTWIAEKDLFLKQEVESDSTNRESNSTNQSINSPAPHAKPWWKFW